MKKFAIAALAVVAIGAAIAFAQNIPNPALTGASGAYNASPPTCTAGQWCALQTDANGVLKTTGTGGGGSSSVSITAPLGHATADTAAVSMVPSATASFPVTGTFFQATQPVSAASLPLPTGAALDASVGTTNTDIGPPGATACATDTGSCSLNALLQRLAQRLTTAIAGTSITGTVNPTTAANWGVVATAAAPPANAVYLGANASGATGGHVAGMIACDSHVFKHITSATDTLAVQGVASQTIRICGWRSRAAGVATWFLENTASANANCSSSNTQITGVATEAANTGETMLAAFWTGLANTSGNGLCINSTGTGGVDIDIWYNQY